MDAATSTEPAAVETSNATARLLETADDAASFLPALTNITERAIARWQDDLSVAMSRTIAVKLYKTSIDSTRFLARKVSPEGASSLVHVGNWRTPVIIGATRELVFACVDALFGGDGSEPPHETDRPLSQIELDLMSHVFTLLAEAIQAEFGQVLDAPFETLPAAATLPLDDTGVPDCTMIGCIVSLDISGHHQQALLCFPHAEITALAPRLAACTADQAPRDPEWARKFSDEVTRTPFEVVARMDAGRMMLGKLAGLSAGDVLALPPGAQDGVEITCNDVSLLRCRLAQHNGHNQLTVDHFIDDQAKPGQSAKSQVN